MPLKSEDEACLVEETRLKSEQEEQACLKAVEEEEEHTRIEAEEEARLVEEERLKSEEEEEDLQMKAEEEA